MWNSKPFVIFFCVATAASLLFLFLSYQKVQFYEDLLNNGTLTEGKIVDSYIRTGSKGYGQNHYFVYRFLDSRSNPHINQVIRNEPDSSYKVGGNIEVMYDPRDPSRNIPSSIVPDNIWQPVYSSLIFFAGTLMITLAFGALVFSRFAQTKLRRISLKCLFGGLNDHNKP